MTQKRAHLAYAIFTQMPTTRPFGRKTSLLRWAGVTIGHNARIVSSARFLVNGDLIIGNNTWIGHEVLIAGGNATIQIGENIDIVPRVTLLSGTHEIIQSGERRAGPGHSLPISIGSGSWIGANSTLLGGGEIGEMTIIGASSLVNKSTTPNSLVAGVPIRPINERSP